MHARAFDVGRLVWGRSSFRPLPAWIVFCMTNSDDQQRPGAGWYKDGSNGVLRYWDGHQWTDSTRPLAPPESSESPRHGRTKWIALVGVAVVAVVVAATAGVMTHSSSSNDDDRWSQFPRTLACAPDEETGAIAGWSTNPLATRVDSVTVSHTGDLKLAVTVDFLTAAPPNPGLITSPYSGETIFTPGSLDYAVVIGTDLGAVQTFHTPNGWVAARGDLLINRILDEPVEDYPSEDILTSVETSGRTARFEYNLDGQPKFFDDGPFNPDVRVNAQRIGAPTPESPDGVRTFYESQLCTGETSAPASSTQEPATPPQTDVLDGQAVSPGACAESGICQLSSPSGDYYCTISRTGAFCSSPVGEPLSADTGARLIKVGSDGETGLLADSGGNSHMMSRETMQDSVFDYGQTLTAYGMTCAFDQSTGGASCRHDASGQGFVIDTISHRFF